MVEYTWAAQTVGLPLFKKKGRALPLFQNEYGKWSLTAQENCVQIRDHQVHVA